MDRSTFLKRSGQIGLFSCGAVLLGTKGEKAEQQESQEGHLQRFKEDWVTTLMENMEAQIEEKTRFMLMQSCGRRCARRGAIQIAESKTIFCTLPGKHWISPCSVRYVPIVIENVATTSTTSY